MTTPEQRRAAFRQRYLDYLQSDGWGWLRRAAWGRYGKRCQVCGEEGVQVHHLVYRQNIEDGLPTDLMPLCVACHNGVHRYKPVCERLKASPQDPEIRRAIIRAAKDELMAWGHKENAGTDLAYPRPDYSLTYIPISVKQTFAVCERITKRKAAREAFFGTLMSGLMARNANKGGVTAL